MQQEQAILATVTGDDQHVGFRAMIMKQAIEYNLAGCAKNKADGTVHFRLQGASDRLDSALAAIRAGTDKSSNIKVRVTEDAVNPALSAFTVVDWTSTRRRDIDLDSSDPMEPSQSWFMIRSHIVPFVMVSTPIRRERSSSHPAGRRRSTSCPAIRDSSTSSTRYAGGN
jgi:acylphosphatase